MQEILPLILFSSFITISHAIFVLLAKNYKKSSDILWHLHFWINGTLWLIVIAWIIWFQFNSSTVEFSLLFKLIGMALIIMGTFLMVYSYRKLGLKQLLGYRFFSKEKPKWISSGIFSKLHNPMYDGFVLLFLGFGLVRGITADFYGAIIAFLLGNVFLATMEKEKIIFKIRELL